MGHNLMQLENGKMSTHCQIGLYTDKSDRIYYPVAIIYKHSDGIPRQILPLIQPFLERILQHRKNMSYVSAWLLHHLISVHMINGYPNYIEHGICDQILTDSIDYYYRINPGNIEVYEVTSGNCEEWPLLETISLAG